MTHVHTAALWIAAHWDAILWAWPILTAVLSVVWRAIPQTTRERWAREYPRADALARAARKAGLDLVPVLTECLRAATGKPLPLPPKPVEPAAEPVAGSER